MKRLFLAFVVLSTLTLTSCGWIHETFCSVEDCAEWYIDELADAVEDNNSAKFCELFVDFNKWCNTLSKEEHAKIQAEFLDNPSELFAIIRYAENFGLYLH